VWESTAVKQSGGGRVPAAGALFSDHPRLLRLLLLLLLLQSQAAAGAAHTAAAVRPFAPPTTVTI